MIHISMLTLFMYIPDDPELKEFYKNRAEDHNNKAPGKYADSGFDLGLPQHKVIRDRDISVKLPLNVQCSMYKPNGTPQAYYLYPRSSIIKTPVRLSNSVGIIDRGYRGIITAVVDKIGGEPDFEMDKFNRYFQICHSTLEPFQVVIVDSKEELGLTERNEGGFGSTGR
jgi:dUTP pyrophosphatase|uniref:dUTPase-like domain-containing protein n=1 Tax=viral metagenome TaxID=1070528 RepID=A0A6C0CLG0_9ZZZZ